MIDKDRASALLAQDLGADCLILATDVDAVYSDWGTPEERPIVHATPDDFRHQDFPAGSMGPKLEAACTFVENTGKRAVIGALEDVAEMLAGEAGTVIEP